MKHEKKINWSSTYNKCIEIFKLGFERGKILYSCGSKLAENRLNFFVAYILSNTRFIISAKRLAFILALASDG